MYLRVYQAGYVVGLPGQGVSEDPWAFIKQVRKVMIRGYVW
jgi:hypothetical protein